MKNTKTIVIATQNKGKAKEFEALFNKKGFEVLTLLDFPEIRDVEETGTTFKENALLKSETIAKELNTIVLSDDSGLVVDALHGQPGVYSARYAGEEKNDAKNNAKLLNDLSDYNGKDRKAHFHCSLALSHPKKDSLVIDGKLEGVIAEVPRGENGFGYDSLFYLPNKNKTLAEISQEEKNSISHRANALQKLEGYLDDWLENDDA
ncbi:MAG: XTP/dITP diphosphatase [Alkalibacterium sp.]|uniref:dITP/XTP pyrophosphatase n=1 Tax=Alkalibacterium gilvum TaxID=1130080 RepID=A0A1H6RGA2_9LACT|nr:MULTISPECIES: XTP/dITP diphosphatase [Alkalibacterium]MDN6196102.1 XTP/dITP diphosphatase [Atopostipes suicloacalis]MDN6293471.1 XTP/dITP diphosphatase [Alkalibacterium sp.]MDN6295186.1 XTP/dITP diphosphatase [Alkalibacterium sp.]MDN6327620.1 XTP/dITP diphosphatase [Alkalibacterium sp.]MDN6385879.1 XTP/dITP diphosphatase [Alkalibacterium sp.]